MRKRSKDFHGSAVATLSKLSGRIQRYLRNKVAVAKVRACPILPGAFATLQTGLELGGLPDIRAESPEIVLLRNGKPV
jgi:hypothetical protein